MFKLINSIYKLLQKPEASYHPNADYSSDLDNVPRWPPFDNGLPNIEVEKILLTQAELIKNINGIIRNPLVNEAINNFVRYVHLLPATKDENHRGAGGLFRMGLEIAYFSVRASEGKIFTAAETPDVRQQTEPKWRFAAFLAGLCCDTYRVMSGMVITASDGTKWPALNIPLYEWLTQNNHERYYLRWVPNASLSSHQAQTMSSYVASQIIPIQATQQISTDFNEIALALMATINGSGLDHPNPLNTIVQDVRMRVIQKDIDGDKSSFGQAMVGSHIEPYIITAMRKLISNGSWTINVKGSRIWVDQHGGIYVIWKTAYQEILQQLENTAIKGVPNDMHVLADMMVKGGAFKQDTAKNSNYWMIYPPTSNESYPAVKIESMDVLFDLDTQRAIKPVVDDLRKQKLPAQITPKPQPKASNKPSNEQKKIDAQVVTSNPDIIHNNQADIFESTVQQNVQRLDEISEQIETVNLTTDEQFIPPHTLDESNIDISSHIVYADDDSVLPPVEEAPYVDPEMDSLIPSVSKDPQLSPLQAIELQKLAPKTAEFLESVILSHQLSKISSNKKPIGFIYKHQVNTKKSLDLYAIPLTHADTMKLDRALVTGQLHDQKFAWIEDGDLKKVLQLTVPYTNKKEMCVILKPNVSKLFDLIN